ncbi:MAG: EVE domain-containing protein [Planctomycetota bacterium]|nr:EVE domain-containing protein [Planctomycetota bacterium]
MATFLFKTEPSEFSYDDLQRDKRCTWDGVANPAALASLRTCSKGDEVFIYHTGDEKAIVGLAQVTKGAYPDPNNPGENAKGEIATPVVDLKPLRRAKTPLTLATIKSDERFATFSLVKQSRLSVMPVPRELDLAIRTLAGL